MEESLTKFRDARQGYNSWAAMARPVTQFCCGCSLIFGAYFILTCNLLHNLFTIVAAVSNIILKVPAFGASLGLPQQTMNALTAVLGLPFIAGGFFGTYYRLETNLRLYLIFRLFCFAMDIGYMVHYFIFEDMCRMVPGAMMRAGGSAFACGFMRMTAVLSVVLVLIVEIYTIWCIWSLCESLKVGGGELGLPQLQQDATRKHKYNMPRYDDEGIYGGHGKLPVAYGAMPGVGGATRIYGGHYHETEYPPVHHEINAI